MSAQPKTRKEITREGQPCERCGSAMARHLVTVKAAVTLKNVPMCVRCRNTMIRKFPESESVEILKD